MFCATPTAFANQEFSFSSPFLGEVKQRRLFELDIYLADLNI